MTSCGPGASGPESCCTSLEVTGGTYYRTYTNDGTGPSGEADPATISGFRMDKYLVTVGRFRQFVSAVLPPNGGAGWLPSPGSGKHTHLNGGNGLNATGGGYEPGWVAKDDGNIAPTNANLACKAPYDTWTNAAGTQENLPVNCVNWWESYAFCIRTQEARECGAPDASRHGRTERLLVSYGWRDVRGSRTTSPRLV